MKLSDYMKKLKYLTLYAREEGQVTAVLQDDERKSEAYDTVVRMLHEAIKHNRSALGIYKEGADAEKEDVSRLKDLEIKETLLTKHIALVRSDLMEAVRGSDMNQAEGLQIAKELLSDLTQRTGTYKDLGKLGSMEEKEIVARERKPKPVQTPPARTQQRSPGGAGSAARCRTGSLNATPSELGKNRGDAPLEEIDFSFIDKKPYSEMTAWEKRIYDQTKKALEARLRAEGKIK